MSSRAAIEIPFVKILPRALRPQRKKKNSPTAANGSSAQA